jgi:hypothetical protein
MHVLFEFYNRTGKLIYHYEVKKPKKTRDRSKLYGLTW